MTSMYIDQTKQQLIVAYQLDTCEQCGNFMLPQYGDARYLPQHLKNTARVMNIREEHWQEWDICDDCVAAGGFPKTCAICNHDYSFPGEFAFIIETYPKYPDDETSYEYVCKTCIHENHEQTINIVIKADGVKDIRKGLK